MTNALYVAGPSPDVQMVLRATLRGAYDEQKLRIQLGNRIVGAVKSIMKENDDADAAIDDNKPKPAKKEDASLTREGKQILKDVTAAYGSITEGVAQQYGEGKLITPNRFTAHPIIPHYILFSLISQYLTTKQNEEDHFAMLAKSLDAFPVYSEYLSKITGVGPIMAGVCLSELNIYEAARPSSFVKYAGIDAVAEWSFNRVYDDYGVPEEVLAAIPDKDPFVPAHNEELLTYCEGEPEVNYVLNENILRLTYKGAGDAWGMTVEYTSVCKGGRSRRKEHLVEVEYIASDGTLKTRKSLSYNAFLHDKLLGVLGPSFIKQNPEKSKYRAIYQDHKQRLQQNPKYSEHNKMHIHRICIRKAIKWFLLDLHQAWRRLEGLPVIPTYEEAKLGIVHGTDYSAYRI